MFDSILNYYRTGILEKPPIASDKSWYLELQFWEICKTPWQSDFVESPKISYKEEQKDLDECETVSYYKKEFEEPNLISFKLEREDTRPNLDIFKI